MSGYLFIVAYIVLGRYYIKFLANMRNTQGNLRRTNFSLDQTNQSHFIGCVRLMAAHVSLYWTGWRRLGYICSFSGPYAEDLYIVQWLVRFYTNHLDYTWLIDSLKLIWLDGEEWFYAQIRSMPCPTYDLLSTSFLLETLNLDPQTHAWYTTSSYANECLNLKKHTCNEALS